jgi:hypothetical protein
MMKRKSPRQHTVKRGGKTFKRGKGSVKSKFSGSEYANKKTSSEDHGDKPVHPSSPITHNDVKGYHEHMQRLRDKPSTGNSHGDVLRESKHEGAYFSKLGKKHGMTTNRVRSHMQNLMRTDIK